MKAIAELGFVPDGAARALSSRLKHVVGVVFRRVYGTDDGGTFADETESLLFGDQINRGIEIAAGRRGFDLLVCSVNIDERTLPNRILTIAGKCDGLILHDQVLSTAGLETIARTTPWSPWPASPAWTWPTSAAKARTACASWPGTWSRTTATAASPTSPGTRTARTTSSAAGPSPSRRSPWARKSSPALPGRATTPPPGAWRSSAD
ncbi:hypothetical protein ACFQZC_25070 [Streptacidiphilus monticola]